MKSVHTSNRFRHMLRDSLLQSLGSTAHVPTSQRLQQRITQHVPKSVRGVHTFQDRTSLVRSCKPIKSLNTKISSSAIGQHLLHNQLCAQNYSDDKFSILAHGRTAFHLLTLEATYIKTSKPNLCKQKEFVYSLKISH